MNNTFLKSRKVIIGIATTAILVGGGAVAFAIASDPSDQVTGTEKDRVSRAAVDVVPGTALKVEREDSDDRDGEAFDVLVKGEDGTLTEVSLGKDLKVLRTDSDDDFVNLTPAQRSAIEAATSRAFPKGVLTEIEYADDHGATYEVKVLVTRGNSTTEYDVYLDHAFTIVHQVRD
jgi:hypothetical protein